MFPTISSMTSSIVTSPATPPYSSTMRAICVDVLCISCSRSSTGLLSGIKIALRATSTLVSDAALSGFSWIKRETSLIYKTPLTSSRFLPITGRRENPYLKNALIDSCREASTEITAMSILGTMISRAMVSDNSSTESISSCSNSSVTSVGNDKGVKRMFMDFTTGAKPFSTLLPNTFLPTVLPTTCTRTLRPKTISSESRATTYQLNLPGVKDWLTTIPKTPKSTIRAKAMPSVERSSSSFRRIAASETANSNVIRARITAMTMARMSI